MAELKKVLSIDGGGIRGIIPAKILAYMEQQTGKPISQMFDLIAGTSTGGILALGLVAPSENGNPRYEAEDLAELYKTEGSNIFSRSAWYKLRAIGNLANAKYPSDGIEDVLDKYFGTSRLKEAITEIIITGYEIERRSPWFFKSTNAKNPEHMASHDFLMKIVARATSAAPTYFDPFRIDTTDNSDYYALVDGGVFANNPAMCAYAEARKMFPGDDILLVSLGTGELTRRIPLYEAKDWGLTEWAKPILDVVFDGVADTIDYQLKQILPDSNYFRFQVRLSEGNDDMDDSSQTNLRVLQLLAEELISDNKEELGNLCDLL